MNPPINQISIEELLHEVYEKTESRDYVGALALLEIVRSSDPRNIYLSALKRQLEPMFMLAQTDELSEDRRAELMDPMPGIIECILRENLRQGTSATTSFLPAPEPLPAVHEAPAPEKEHPKEMEGEVPAASTDAQKELEALKLLYFQRASKCVMKGEYEQALAEVRRVFVVDPENAIAREYATRVELLIEHARRLASSPPEPAAPPPEEPTGFERTSSPADIPPVHEESAHIHSERSTAWNDNFLAPKNVAIIPEHRTAASSSRQTVAYGDSLAVALNPPVAPPAQRGSGRRTRRSSGKKFILVIALVVAVVGGGSIAVLSSGKSGGNQLAHQAGGTIENAESAQLNQASENIVTPQAQVAQQAAQATPTIQDPPALGAETPRSTPEQKATAPSTRHETLRESPAVAEQKPPSPKSAVEQSVSVPAASTPVAGKSADAEPIAASAPAFVPVEKDPQIIKLEKPHFPSFVWNTGMEGQVIVKVLIDTDGKPIDTQILKSTSAVFEDGVIEAVMKSQFSPAQMGQGPVTAWLTIPFKFRQPK